MFLLAEFGEPHALAGFSALGELHKPAEKVAGEAVHFLLEFLKSGAPVDSHLADQLLLYCSLAQGESNYSVEKVSDHLVSNASVVKKFLPECEIEVAGEVGGKGSVRVFPK